LRDLHRRIGPSGARLVLVLCQRLDAIRHFLRSDPLPFPVAADEDRSAARAYGVYQLLGFDAFRIARPATFVIDARGIIRRRFVARFQWQSLPIERIVETLPGPIPAA